MANGLVSIGASPFGFSRFLHSLSMSHFNLRTQVRETRSNKMRSKLIPFLLVALMVVVAACAPPAAPPTAGEAPAADTGAAPALATGLEAVARENTLII